MVNTGLSEVCGQETNEREAGHRLAAARLADQPERLARA
jgi:hypothetical protein